MTSSADVIVLTSSPTVPPRLPSPVAYETEATYVPQPAVATTPRVPSPSSLFVPPSRSRFFDAPARKQDTTNKKRPAKKATAPKKSKKAAGPSETPSKLSKAHGSTAHDGKEQNGDNGQKKAAKPRAPRKPRAKPKAQAESGALKLSGKVIKAGKPEDPGLKPVKKRAGRKQTAVQSTSEDCMEKTGLPTPSNALGKDEDLNLDEATRRRRDWTPPAETMSHPISTGCAQWTVAEVSDTSNKAGFGDILTDYTYSRSGSATAELRATSEGVPTKRRKIDLLEPQGPSRALRRKENLDQDDSSSTTSSGRLSARKIKPQKRFTTLTARMTAQYGTENTEDEPGDKDLTQYIVKCDSKRNSKTKAKAQQSSVVLSPEAAFQTLDQQDVIFASSSETIRLKHFEKCKGAFRMSEDLAFQRRAGIGDLATSEPSMASEDAPDLMSRSQSKKRLWSVAGRDMQGSLVQAELVESLDLTDLSLDNNTAIPPQCDSTVRALSNAPSDDDWLDLDNGKAGLSLATKVTNIIQTTTALKSKMTLANTSKQAAQETQPVLREIEQPRSVSQLAPMPQYSGFTDAELSKQVAAYGFKSVKGRKKMIDLLQKCWESKFGKADLSASVPGETESATNSIFHTVQKTVVPPKTASKSNGIANAKKNTSTLANPPQKTKIVTPKKSKQLPPNDAQQPPTSSYIDIEEIQDSEDEPLLSPVQVQAHYTKNSSASTQLATSPSRNSKASNRARSPQARKLASSKVLPVTERIKRDTAIRTSEPISDQDLKPLLTQITSAVRAQSRLPQANSRARPTWHEKILMFDPIMLEDFTAWLNVEGLGLVDEDREVNTALVRDWCESKGICCGWKKNTSG
ncbi:hypothetical protein N7539_001472 [Penicillium diatomitis]|uniref:Structure-specific endonuclease subunit SLX4 n=1 Tax=Penicillium diatomitis TaxID=2819901 RepID=A0A9W9XGT8_9EURO|nr:uncharacterized protein N7539_001472 [Penicillium diatomitis]KAJ5492726.1 hypothetical protein N7539_001472 [Penicillium diatomitis]